jgi:hypothetical protein
VREWIAPLAGGITLQKIASESLKRSEKPIRQLRLSNSCLLVRTYKADMVLLLMNSKGLSTSRK